jgi:TetR/AcrR family transcriptional repressor of nem operon
VIAEAGSSKGAFFHHFSSKTDLAAQVVQRYVAADLAHLDAGLAATAHITDPTARVLAFLRHYEDGADELMSEQTGCLYATVLAEREFTGSEINDQVAKATRVWRDAVADLLRAALATRRSGVDIDVEALADHLYTTFEGGYILCRTYTDRSAMRAQLRIYRQLVEALLRAD